MDPPAARSRYGTFIERLKDNPIRNEKELETAVLARTALQRVRHKFRDSEDPADKQKIEQANIATNLVRQRIAEYASGVAAQTPASSELKTGGYKTVAREAMAKELEGRPIKDAEEYTQVKKYQKSAQQRSRDLAEGSAAERDRETAQAEFFKQKLKEFEALEEAKAKAKAKAKARPKA